MVYRAGLGAAPSQWEHLLTTGIPWSQEGRLRANTLWEQYQTGDRTQPIFQRPTDLDVVRAAALHGFEVALQQLVSEHGPIPADVAATLLPTTRRIYMDGFVEWWDRKVAESGLTVPPPPLPPPAELTTEDIQRWLRWYMMRTNPLMVAAQVRNWVRLPTGGVQIEHTFGTLTTDLGIEWPGYEDDVIVAARRIARELAALYQAGQWPPGKLGEELAAEYGLRWATETGRDLSLAGTVVPYIMHYLAEELARFGHGVPVTEVRRETLPDGSIRVVLSDGTEYRIGRYEPPPETPMIPVLRKETDWLLVLRPTGYWKPVYYRNIEYLADGTERVTPWYYTGFGHSLSLDDWQRFVGREGARSFRRWDELTDAERQTVLAEAGPEGARQHVGGAMYLTDVIERQGPGDRDFEVVDGVDGVDGAVDRILEPVPSPQLPVAPPPTGPGPVPVPSLPEGRVPLPPVHGRPIQPEVWGEAPSRPPVPTRAVPLGLLLAVGLGLLLLRR